MGKKVYVVQDLDSIYDNVIGIFSDKKYVYSVYNSSRFLINEQSINNTKHKVVDLNKYGRSDYMYKNIKVDKIKSIDDFVCKAMTDSETLVIYNIIDPNEGDFVIEINKQKQPHTIDNLSLVADIFCEYNKINKENIIIYTDYKNRIFLGSLVEFDDNAFNCFCDNDVEIYY